MSNILNLNDKTTGEIVLYQPDDTIRLEVKIEDETVWLTQAQMAELFQTTIPNVNLHLKNIYEECELEEFATIKDFLIVRQEGKRRVQRYTNQMLAELQEKNNWIDKPRNPIGFIKSES